MPVLEIIGALAAVSELIVYLGKTVEGIHGIVQEGRYADGNVEALVRELQHTQWFISGCKTICAIILGDRSWEGFPREELLAMEREARTLAQHLREVQPSGEVKKIKWIRKSSRCKDLAHNLAKGRERLQQSLAILQVRYSDMIFRRDLPASEALYTAVDMDRGCNQLLSVEMIGDESDSRSSSVSHQIPSEAQSVSSSISLLPREQTRNSVSGPRRPDGDKCQQDCVCRCHKAHLARRSTPFLRTRLCPVDYKLGTVVCFNSCSDPDCRASSRRDARFIASYSSNLFSRLLTASILFRGLRASAGLDVPKYVPEYADVVRATLNGDIEWLKRIFSSRLGSPNDSSIDGWSLLHTAAYYSQLETAKFLLDQGAQVNVTELKQRTPFHFSMIKSLKQNASPEQKKIAELMWASSIKTDCALSKEHKFIDEFKLTPIHACILHLHDKKYEAPDLVRLLDLVDEARNQRPGRDWNAWAKEYEVLSPTYTDVIRLYESRAENPDKSQTSRNLPEVGLIDQGDTHNWTPLHWAAYTGRFEELRTLIEHNANTMQRTSSGRNVFHHAAESGDGETMAFLAQQPYVGSDLDVNLQDLWGETPLYIASGRTAAAVKHLLQLGAKVSVRQAEKRNPLHEAYQANDENRAEIVRLLCDADIESIHAVDAGGKTPIFEYLRDAQCFSILIERGAKLDICDKEKRNLFHYACKKGEGDVLGLLIDHFRRKPFTQLKLNKLAAAKDARGSTPIREAFLARSANCVKRLLEMPGLCIAAFVGPNGWTALHHAARLGDLSVLKMVLEGGRWDIGDLLRLTVDGKIVEQIACDNGHYHGMFRKLLDAVKVDQQRMLAAGSNGTQASENLFYYAARSR